MNIHHLSADTLNDFVTSHSVVYLNFWHQACGSCIRMVDPALKKILRFPEFPSEVKIAKLNTLKNPELAEEFGIQAVPSYGIYIEGTYMGTRNGFITGIQRPIKFFTQLLKERQKAIDIGIHEYLKEFDENY